MSLSIIRFYQKGWIAEFYLTPKFHFSYDGFEWAVPPESPTILYGIYLLLLLSAVCIMLGLFFRPAVIVFFLLFTYTELWDKAVYLNHYYLISLLSFLMVFLPMSTVASVDSRIRRRTCQLKKWPISPELLLKIQVGSVYFFGGIAKIGYDWLVLGQPLKIWLSSNSHLPLIGSFLALPVTAIAISWFALLFDLSAPFLLFFRKTRPWIYPVAILFHAITAFLFPIGMFPWFMCVFTLVFFRSSWHRHIMSKLFPPHDHFHHLPAKENRISPFVLIVLSIFFLFQVLMPFRCWLYPGNPLWHEQGFRFSWRIMLMEKNGSTEYTVKVKETGNSFEVVPSQYLTQRQVTQMSFQPDMILQFSHFLHRSYLESGLGDTQITAKSYVSLNGRGSRLLIDPDTDLATQKTGWANKRWITQSPK